MIRIHNNQFIVSLLICTTALLRIGGCATSTSWSSDAAASEYSAMLTATSARAEDELADFTVQRTPWEFASQAGHIIETPNYRIRTTLRYDHLLDQIPVFLESALDHYRTAIVDLPAPKGPMESYIFQTRQQWSAKTRELLPQEAGMFQNLGRGGYTTRGICVLYYIDWAGRYRDTFAIASHEGWHQYTQTVFRQSLPVWLEEGLATYMEGFRISKGDPEFQPWRNSERREALHEAVRDGRLIPLERLLAERPQDFLKSGKNELLTYYAQVWALVRFLAETSDEKYRPALGRALRNAVDGSLHRNIASSPAVRRAQGRRSSIAVGRGSWLILAYFNADLREFEREYLEFVRVIASSGPYRRWRD